MCQVLVVRCGASSREEGAGRGHRVNKATALTPHGGPDLCLNVCELGLDGLQPLLLEHLPRLECTQLSICIRATELFLAHGVGGAELDAHVLAALHDKEHVLEVAQQMLRRRESEAECYLRKLVAVPLLVGLDDGRQEGPVVLLSDPAARADALQRARMRYIRCNDCYSG